MALKSLPYLLLIPLFCPALTRARKGFLAVGGLESPDSAELWRPPPNSWSCSIPPPPRQMLTPSVNLLGGTPLACYMDSCDWLTENGWEMGPSTLFNRTYHSSHILGDDRLLLMGGRASPNTSEILQIGEEAQESFNLSPGRNSHCSIKVSESTIVVTGGWWYPQAQVTQYSGIGEGEVLVRDLPSLITGRLYHACGFYSVGELQTLIVAGGLIGGYSDSTELLDYSNVDLGWREAGRLPSPRYGLAGAHLNGVFHVSGGRNSSTKFSDILAWDPVAEQWSESGYLAVPRNLHSLTEVGLSHIEGLCQSKIGQGL